MDADSKFETIINDALAKAASVDCSPSTYRANLRSWIDEIRTCIKASEETSPDDG